MGNVPPGNVKVKGVRKAPNAGSETGRSFKMCWGNDGAELRSGQPILA